MSSAPFDSRLTGRSLALGLLDGHGRDALPPEGQTMVPIWGIDGPGELPYGTLGPLVGRFAPPGRPSSVAVREDCLDGGL